MRDTGRRLSVRRSVERLHLRARTQPNELQTSQPAPKRDWWATVWIPLVVAALAFGGGALGSWLSSNSNSESIRAERERAIEQFRRDERREQYATILQQATRLQNASSFSTLAVGSLAYIAGFNPTTEPKKINETPVEDGGPTAAARGMYDWSQGLFGTTSDKLGSLGGVRDTWQDAYTGLDQAISNAEIASTTTVINVARALRDRYRVDYAASVRLAIDESIKTWPDPKPDPLKLAESLVGVPAETTPPTYDPNWIAKSTDELTAMYVQAAKADLGLDDR